MDLAEEEEASAEAAAEAATEAAAEVEAGSVAEAVAGEGEDLVERKDHPQKLLRSQRCCMTANPSWSAAGRLTKRSLTSTLESTWITSAKSVRSTRSSARPPNYFLALRWILEFLPRASSRMIFCISEPTSCCPLIGSQTRALQVDAAVEADAEVVAEEEAVGADEVDGAAAEVGVVVAVVVDLVAVVDLVDAAEGEVEGEEAEVGTSNMRSTNQPSLFALSFRQIRYYIPSMPFSIYNIILCIVAFSTWRRQGKAPGRHL